MALIVPRLQMAPISNTCRCLSTAVQNWAPSSHHRTQPVIVKIRALIALLALCPTLGVGQPALTLHYHKPASEWTEALPIGNGSMGS
jgi:hypothetical protein